MSGARHCYAAVLSHVPHMAPWAHLPRIAQQAPARIHRGAGRSPANIGGIKCAYHSFESTNTLLRYLLASALSAHKSPHVSVLGAGCALLTSAVSNAHTTASRVRIRFSVISWQAHPARIKARPHPSGSGPQPCSSSAVSNAHPTASRVRIRFSVISWQAHSPHARRPLPRPLQRPTSHYLSGSVISCTAPSSFSSIHPPRTASGGVALRQLRRAVIS